MKKILALGAIALFGAMNGQTEKGTWMISGKTNLSFNSAKTKIEFEGQNIGESKTSTFTFGTSANYFVINNLSVGLGVNYKHDKMSDDKSDTFVVMPQATYFFPVAGNIKPYVEAGIGYATNKTSDDQDEFKMSGLAYGAGAGVAYFVNPNVAFNLGLNYSATNLKLSEGNIRSKVSNFGAGVGVSVFFK